MKMIVCASALSLLLVGGCGSKVDGTYAIDVGATRATPDFIEKDRQTRGAAALGLQVFSQLAPTLMIKGSAFRLVTLDCKLNADLTKAECKDEGSPSAPVSTLGFSLADGVARIVDPSNGYPIAYRNTKVAANSTSPRKP